MKIFTTFSLWACVLLAAATVNAQSLFNLVPALDGDEEDSIIQWTANVGLGYDDNVNNGDGAVRAEQDSTFVRAFVQATYANVDARTRWQVSARLGLVYFFEEVNIAGGAGVANVGNNRNNSDSGLNYSLTHRISNRLRFNSVGSVSYQLEPDLQNGLAANRQLGEFLSYNISNQIGYEIDPTIGVVFGFRLNGISYDEADVENRNTYTFTSQFRYRMSDRTVFTGDYRYMISDNEQAFDSTSHIITGGLEHRFSRTSIMTMQVGAQLRRSDLGNADRNSPFVELGLRTRITSQLRTRIYSRLMQEDGGLFAPGGGQFGSSLVWRTGIDARYTLNSRLAFTTGLTWVSSRFDDGNAGGATTNDYAEDVINLSLGFNYSIYNNLTLTGTYNFTNSSSDNVNREFDRNRFLLGVQTQF